MSFEVSKVNFDDLDTEQLVSFEGYDYRLSSGTSGLQLNIKECPNCHNENWKVYLNADTGLGNCFVCDQKYSKFSFIKIARGFPHNSQVFQYVKSYGDGLTYRPKVKSKPVFTPMNKDWRFPLNEKIAKDEQIGDYLKNRNIDLKIAERFDLRRCDYGLYDFINLNGKKQYVDFSNRIIIPIKDIDGNIVTFQGRDITGNAERKYLFPNMLPATGAFIYNADYALKNNYKKIVLGEGVFDVYAITQALESDVTMNDYCACGTFGKHLSISNNKTVTVDQMQDLFRLRENGLEEIVMLWDGEPKAIAKAMETAQRLQNLGFDNVKVGVLPAGCDPGETSKEEVLKAIKESKKVTPISLIRYRLSNVS